MKLKNIHLLDDSHFDVAVTRSEVVLEWIQTDFINQTLDLLDAIADGDESSQPRWTIEVHHQLKFRLESATPEKIARLKRHIQQQRPDLGAVQSNIMLLNSVESHCKQLSDIRRYRAEPRTNSISHRRRGWLDGPPGRNQPPHCPQPIPILEVRRSAGPKPISYRS